MTDQDQRIQAAIHAYGAGQLDAIPPLTNEYGDSVQEPAEPTTWDDPLLQESYNMGRATGDRMWRRMVSLANWISATADAAIETGENAETMRKSMLEITDVIEDLHNEVHDRTVMLQNGLVAVARLMFTDYVGSLKEVEEAGWDRDKLVEMLRDMALTKYPDTLDNHRQEQWDALDKDTHEQAARNLADHFSHGVELDEYGQLAYDLLQQRHPQLIETLEEAGDLVQQIRGN